LHDELLRNGISIKKSQILKILTGEHFTGKVVNMVSGRKKVFEYQYPQLVNDELYKQCRDIVHGKVNRKSDKQNKFKFYANRVVKCAECGKYLYAVLSNNKGLYCYTCSKNRYLPEGETKCIGGVSISVKIIDSLGLYYAYRAQMIELATDRTESMERAKQAIVDLTGKIAKAGEQYEILKSAKRKKLKKELSFIVGHEFEMLLERAMSNDKKRIDREVIEWQDQIRKHNAYISDQGNIQAKYNMRIKGQKSIVSLDSPMVHYHEFSEQERYDLVHRYVDEILCRKVEKYCVEITINLINGFSKKIFYHSRQKEKDRKLTDENNNPLSWIYYILG
jgi:hypothetical protein